MNNAQDKEDGSFIRIFGHGTLSGDRLPHPSHAEPPVPNGDNWPYHPIDIQGALVNCFISPIQTYVFYLKLNFYQWMYKLEFINHATFSVLLQITKNLI